MIDYVLDSKPKSTHAQEPLKSVTWASWHYLSTRGHKHTRIAYTRVMYGAIS